MSRLCLLSLLLLLTISPIAAGQSAEPGKPSPSDIAKAKNENDDRGRAPVTRATRQCPVASHLAGGRRRQLHRPEIARADDGPHC